MAKFVLSMCINFGKLPPENRDGFKVMHAQDCRISRAAQTRQIYIDLARFI